MFEDHEDLRSLLTEAPETVPAPTWRLDEINTTGHGREKYTTGETSIGSRIMPGPVLLSKPPKPKTPEDKPKFGKHLPTDAVERKAIPIYSGVFKYFPDALVEIAKLSQKGNDQHNPGQPLHWAREKSTDQEDTLLRHLLEAGTLDTDGVRHSAKVAWRALAKLQLEIEADRAKEDQSDD